MAAGEEKDGMKEKVAVITASYRVNLHCQQCARKIKRHLMRTQGVEMVEVDMEKSEIKVKGKVDAIKIQKQIEKLSKKRVELKEKITTQAKKETKELVSHTVEVKIHMHCNKCEQDLKKNLLMHKGIHGVKTDMKTQTLIVDGTLESDKLIAYLRKKLHKHAETITLKTDKKQEKKEEKIEEKKEEKKVGEEEKKKVVEKEKYIELIKAIEVNEETKIVEVKSKDVNAPYFIHYVYAPQLFSDENPNACYVM